jgi:glyoxylase-like metal-dependent hydrolase (beta-lactamase superfamily II)
VRAVSLHRDVIVVTSAVLQVNCVIVRGEAGDADETHGGSDRPGETDSGSDRPGEAHPGETFVIDSPVLPEELDALPALVEQARFPAPSGLLATHGDWDHLLGRLAFPGASLGCAESTAARLDAAPGEAQRQLRAFDEDLTIQRPRPLALGAVVALPVPGRCELGDREIELHPTGGHTVDGMAAMLKWAGILVTGDYLSAVEIPTLSDGGEVDEYLATLERLHGLVREAEHVVPGHGPLLDRARALALLEEDTRYLRALAERGTAAELPAGRGNAANRRAHMRNAAGHGRR